MVLTKAELIESLQNEVRILLHLATKIDRTQIDYRPTPKQRSTLELLQYLSIMGPALLDVALKAKFDVPAWTAEETKAYARSLDEALGEIASHAAWYEQTLSAVPDEAMREQVDLFAMNTSRGSFIVNQVLAGCAAYRTQLFVYLKACGRTELGTTNLWGGFDAQ